jgi:hypothetical protein
MKKLLILLVVLGVLAILWPTEVMADSTAVITITNTPYFVSVDITPSSWTINGLTGDGYVDSGTTYYSNPLGDTASPTVSGALDSECYFTATNGMADAVDLTVTTSDFTGGSDNSTNSNAGVAGPTSYGAYSYFAGQSSAQWVICQSSGSSLGYSNLAGGGDVNFGLIISEQTNSWTGDSSASSTITITTAAH